MRSWLSPPDPSKNHNIALGAHHGGTAEWFIQCHTFEEWNAEGSLLWVHGKRTSFPYLLSILVVDCRRSPDLVAGSGKSILWYVSLHLTLSQHVYSTEQLDNYPGNQDEMRSWISSDGILLL